MAVVGSGVGVAIVAGGALLTTFNEGLSDLLGVSRVTFAMSRGKDLPEDLSQMSSDKNPWRSVLFVGAIAILVVAFSPFIIAVAVSSFGTLLYYTITNLSALKLKEAQRMFPRVLAISGLVGCLGLAFLLPLEDVAVGLAILLGGLSFRRLRIFMSRHPTHRPSLTFGESIESVPAGSNRW